MRTTLASVLSTAAGLCITCAALADAPGDAALNQLKAQYPGVLVLESPGGQRSLYGRTLNDAKSAAQAANDFVNAHRAVFGAGTDDLAIREHNQANFGALDNFVFSQRLAGLPVENAFISVVVRTLPAAQGLPDPLVHAVVLAQGLTAPATTFAPIQYDAKQAQDGVRGMKGYDDLTDWFDNAEMVVYFDPAQPQVAPVRAWKFSAAHITPDNPRAFTFFVDAASGALVHARNDIHHFDVTGSVVGLVTPPNLPDIATNPPVQQPIGEVKVEVVGNPTAFAYTDRAGNFTITGLATGDPVTLRVSAGGGKWNAVTNNGAPAFNVTQSATPGTPVTINLLSAPTGLTQAQVNGLVYANQTHNFITDRANIPTLNSNPPIATNVNEASTCNAFYQAGPPDSIHFFAPGGGCVNTAYASVVNHEYGHYIVNERNLGQGAFGEGFADVMSVLINDDPIIGREFGTAANFPPDGAIRHLDGSAEVLPNYPCAGEVHFCGEVLGNISWVIRTNMNARYGAPMGLDMTRDLFGDWAVFMTGADAAGNAAHPATALEVLTADDNDGNISNGTPNYPQIRPAFEARSIAVPCVDARVIIQPQAVIPAVITTGSQPITVPVTVSAGSAQVVGTPVVKWRLGASGSFQSIPMTPAGPPGSYTANFPTLTCGQAIQYYYSVNTSETNSTVNPPTTELTFPSHTCGDANGTFSTQATDTSTSVTETFESATSSWVRTLAGGGSWIRSDFTSGAVSTGSNPTSDTTPAPGINAWITGKDFQTNPNAGDLDGTSILTSPPINLAGAAGAIVSYQRWFSLTSPGTGDELRVEVANDEDGTNWVVGERLTATEGNLWKTGGFSLGALGVTPTATTRVRFVGVDLTGTTDTTFEAGIDDLVISTLQCNTGSSCDPIDFNGDTLFPDTADIADFLTVFGGGACPTGTCGDIDFNNDGLFPDTDDITALLRVFAGGNC